MRFKFLPQSLIFVTLSMSPCSHTFLGVFKEGIHYCTQIHTSIQTPIFPDSQLLEVSFNGCPIILPECLWIRSAVDEAFYSFLLYLEALSSF